MSWRQPRQFGVMRGILLLGAGLVFVFGLTGWAIEFAPGEPGRIFPSAQRIVTEAAASPDYVGIEAELDVESSGRSAMKDEPQRGRIGAGGSGPKHRNAAHGAERAQARPTAPAAPTVEVRVGDHGEFERVVFEWRKAVDYDVVRSGNRVVVAFGRPGRIDLSRLRDGFGRRIVEARAEGGGVTSRIVLGVLPEAKVHSFGLKDDRIVVIDVSGKPAPQRLTRRAPIPKRRPIPELKRAVGQRDAVITDLLARVEKLERKITSSSGDLDRVVAGGAPNATAKPGALEVVEEEIDRALERTLVQTGALLLPFGQAEIEPFFSYSRRESDAPALAFINGVTTGAEVELRRNEFVTGLMLRFGLPFDSQLEFTLPYRFADQSTVMKVGFAERDEMDRFGHGMGDISIGVAKTLIRENGHWWPDLIGRVAWDTDTGKTSSNNVALGGGFNEVRGSLSAVKRQDPLAFVGSVTYERAFENDNVEPGDELGFTFGTFLAASPATSLRLVLDQRFIGDSRVDGNSIDGSDGVAGMATIGASVVLGRGVLLDVAADIGLTDDAPDYAARISLPIRLDFPVF